MTTPPPSSAHRAGSPDGARRRQLKVFDTPQAKPAPQVEPAPQVASEAAISAAPEPDSTAAPDGAPRMRPVTDVRPGALLAVCGLCGGAGTSTLAYLIGLFAAREDPASVLVCDTGGPSGGLAAYADVVAPRSLLELAELSTAGLGPGCPYVTTADGLQVLATAPRFTPACRREGVERVLDQMRAVHALTVVDCGTLTREAEQLVLTGASHVAWVLPATVSGVRRAGAVLEAINHRVGGRELVIARRDTRDRQATLAQVKALASSRSDTLIIVPYLPDLAKAPPAVALELAQVPLQAIHGALQR
jgi:MinD-like ATPase involved in chromosome partitioning or flagellar assembly